MLDHAGFPVSDYERSKAFYEKALAPLGYVLVMEVPQTENDTPAAGFGVDRGRTDVAASPAAQEFLGRRSGVISGAVMFGHVSSIHVLTV